jgi:hypothetical protein
MNRGPSVPRTPPNGAFLDEDAADGHEHGERAEAVPRPDPLIGTAGTHTPRPDPRAEEPAGDFDDTEAGT